MCVCMCVKGESVCEMRESVCEMRERECVKGVCMYVCV